MLFASSHFPQPREPSPFTLLCQHHFHLDHCQTPSTTPNGNIHGCNRATSRVFYAFDNGHPCWRGFQNLTSKPPFLLLLFFLLLRVFCFSFLGLLPTISPPFSHTCPCNRDDHGELRRPQKNVRRSAGVYPQGKHTLHKPASSPFTTPAAREQQHRPSTRPRRCEPLLARGTQVLPAIL